jgi:hypothetical protein
MPMTEDRVANLIFKREIDVPTVLQLFYNGDVLVYAATGIQDDATWDEIENRGSNTSGIFHELRMAGADEADMNEVGIQIQRARDEGRTIEKHYGLEPEPVEPEPEPD